MDSCRAGDTTQAFSWVVDMSAAAHRTSLDICFYQHLLARCPPGKDSVKDKRIVAYKAECLHDVAGIPANPGRPLIDFATELPAALAIPAGGYGGPGSKQPQSIKQALEASDQMLAAKEREGNKVCLTGHSVTI